MLIISLTGRHQRSPEGDRRITKRTARRREQQENEVEKHEERSKEMRKVWKGILETEEIPRKYQENAKN